MCKKDLLDAILIAAKDISSDEIKSLTYSMDRIILSLISKNVEFYKILIMPWKQINDLFCRSFLNLILIKLQ